MRLGLYLLTTVLHSLTRLLHVEYAHVCEQKPRTSTNRNRTMVDLETSSNTADSGNAEKATHDAGIVGGDNGMFQGAFPKICTGLC